MSAAAVFFQSRLMPLPGTKWWQSGVQVSVILTMSIKVEKREHGLSQPVISSAFEHCWSTCRKNKTSRLALALSSVEEQSERFFLPFRCSVLLRRPLPTPANENHPVTRSFGSPVFLRGGRWFPYLSGVRNQLIAIQGRSTGNSHLGKHICGWDSERIEMMEESGRVEAVFTLAQCKWPEDSHRTPEPLLLKTKEPGKGWDRSGDVFMRPRETLKHQAASLWENRSHRYS